MGDDAKEIEDAVKSFIGETEKQLKKLADDSAKSKDKEKFPKDITFSMSKNQASVVRTPEEQAAEVQKGKSWTCASSHMSDRARHVILKIGSKSYYGLSEAKELKSFQAEFKKAFGDAMKKAGLKNFKGVDGYASGDEFHLELPDSKLKATDSRVTACFAEYARLTRTDGKAKNDAFEKEFSDEIEKAAKKL